MPTVADADGYGRQVTASLLLALDAAQLHEPVGLATPAIRLAALLDPAGYPHQLWTTDAVTDYLTNHRTPPSPGTPEPAPVTPDQTLAALRLLHQYGLLTSNTHHGHRAVRIHALTARATRETTPEDEHPTIVRTAADALLDAWPEHTHEAPDLTAVLRTNTDTLHAHAGDLLWQPDGHPVLYTAGSSLNDAGLYTTAIAHWHHMVTHAERLLGDHHPDTLTARNNLATSYWQAGRTEEAIAIEEQVVADREHILGDQHPHTLNARNNLTSFYRQAGHTADAIDLLERVVAHSERLLGDQHPGTLTARVGLAYSYWQAGRTEEAIAIEEQVVADRERILGDQHPDTLAARSNLATSYWQAGRTEEAIAIEEQVVADREHILGDQHPHTLNARNNLTSFYRQAGRDGGA
ncbi:tetratricopeptide repeat protein [Kitasatospora sp. NPDC049285]|uniref:tetratricopeptide repeat protein n=1 Tax=Kitasatospora sp. NPDC049285 TaxID=3157096 RepID=UPI003437029C